MQQAHPAYIWRVAQWVTHQVQCIEPGEICQVGYALRIHHNLVTAQVQVGQGTHAPECIRNARERIAVGAQRAQTREMIEERNVYIGQFGAAHIQPGDVIEIAFQSRHGVQVPSQRDIV